MCYQFSAMVMKVESSARYVEAKGQTDCVEETCDMVALLSHLYFLANGKFSIPFKQHFFMLVLNLPGLVED